jgi:hypothetical protein
VYKTEQESNERVRDASRLVNLLDGRAVLAASRATRTGEAAGRTTRAAGEAARCAARCAVELLHDGHGDALELLLLLLVLLLGALLRRIEPRDGLVDGGLELRLVAGLELVREARVVERVAEVVRVRLEAVLRGDAGGGGLVLGLVLLGVVDHALDLLLRQAALVVGDGDAVRLAGGLVGGGDVQNAVRVDVEGDLNLRDATGCRRDARELELAEKVVVLRARTLALEDLDEHTRLVVGVGREDLRLLRRDGGVALDERGEDTTRGLDTGRQRRDVEEEKVLGLLRRVTGENGGLDSGTVGDGLVGVDRLVRLLAVEEVGHELYDTRDTGRTADEDDLVDVRLVDLRVAEDLLDRVEGRAEEVLAQFLEAGTGEGGVEVDTLEERVDLDRRLGGGRESALGTLASGAKTADGAGVGRQVYEIIKSAQGQ